MNSRILRIAARLANTDPPSRREYNIKEILKDSGVKSTQTKGKLPGGKILWKGEAQIDQAGFIKIFSYFGPVKVDERTGVGGHIKMDNGAILDFNPWGGGETTLWGYR